VAVAFAIAGNLRSTGERLASLRASPQQQGRFGPRMPTEEASQFETGIAGCAEHRGFKFGWHQFVSSRPDAFGSILVQFEFEAYLSIIMHKYSSIVNGLAAVSSQNGRSGNPGATGRFGVARPCHRSPC
jgi:hypothetical protein